MQERLELEGIKPGEDVPVQRLHQALEASLGAAVYLHCEGYVLVEV